MFSPRVDAAPGAERSGLCPPPPPRSGEWIGFYGPDLLVWWLAAPSASTEPVLR